MYNRVTKSTPLVLFCIAAVFFAAAGLIWLIPAKENLDGSVDNGMQIAIMLFSLVIAVTFSICALVSSNTYKKQQKRLQMIHDYIKTLPYEGIFIEGYYSEKGMRAKAAAKSAASATGAVLSALFLGIGFYKVSTGILRKEYIVTDRGLLLITPHNKFFDPHTITPIQRKDIYNPQIIEKKNQVILMAGDEKAGYFAFNLKNSNVDKNHLIRTLEKAFIAPIE